MERTISVKPLSLAARIADLLMIPLMHILAWNFVSSAQKTHFWNNSKLSWSDVKHLDLELMIYCEGDITAKSMYLWKVIPRFHIPILGGWKHYIVIGPDLPVTEWYVGWVSDRGEGISRIKLTGPVRLLIGPGGAGFFGINSSGHQIPVKEYWKGVLNQETDIHIPLL